MSSELYREMSEPSSYASYYATPPPPPPPPPTKQERQDELYRRGQQKLTVGKYTGRTYYDVGRSDPSYVEFLRNTRNPQYKDLVKWYDDVIAFIDRYGDE
jgi:hypothetical protein